MGRHYPWAALGCVFILALLAFALRSVPWRNFLGQGGQYLFYGPDSYDHLRRITLGLRSFPAVSVFDSYYGYPTGTGQIWSPLFDYLIAAVVLLFGGSEQAVHGVGFWLPPVLSFFTIFMVYAAGSRFFNRETGIVAAGVVASLPGHILYSLVSELDHHVAEPMICLATVVSLLKAWDRLEKGTPSPADWLGTGGWMVFSILIWRGSVIFWGIVFLALAVQIVAERMHGRDPLQLSRYGRNVCLFAALLIFPVCAFDFWGSARGVDFGIISWFHVILLLSFAGCLHFLARLDRRNIVIAAASLAVTLVAAAVIVPQAKRFLLELVAGISVIGGKDPWLDSISELRPMLFPAGKLDLVHATETLSLFYWLSPVAFVFIYLKWRCSNCRDFRLSLFMIWGGLLWLLPLFRERYVHLAALATALSAGFLFFLWVEKLAAHVKKRWGYVSAFLLLLIMGSPSAAFIRDLPNLSLPEHEKSDLMASLLWLRENSPATSFFSTAEKMPEYGVLSDWGLGAYLDYVARRPTVATNFGWETHGLFESASFLTATQPAHGENILRLNRVRYLFLNDVTGSLPALRGIAEFGVEKKKMIAPPMPPFNPLATMYYRLYIRDGSAYAIGGHTEGALGKYRLVFESANGLTDPFVGFVSHYKIFETVQGAVIKGKAVKGKTVEVKLLLRSPAGRTFTYLDATTAGEDGEFAFVVPYATTGELVAGTRPLGRYAITAGDRHIELDVDEAEIQSGKTVRIN